MNKNLGKEKKDGKIDIIIPAYKAQETIRRTIASIATQTILKDLEVTIVNDCCPNGDYSEIVEMYKPYMKIREIKLEKNGGPGVARQYGIDNTKHQYFTCIDADDTFASAISLEQLKTAFKQSDTIQCVSGIFLQLGEELEQTIPHQNDMVWMFGKLYRRHFINKYEVRFNTTRANEDTGFNTIVRLLCSNPNEQIFFFQDVVYFWHNKEDSITRINDGQYGLDQCFCGWTDNMIYAVNHVRKIRPFDGATMQWMAHVIMRLYYYYVETLARKPVFAKQNWEYVKKYYNTVYRKYASDITEEALSEMFSMVSMESWGPNMIGIIPEIGIHEFLEKLEQEEYNPEDIFEIWNEMAKDEDTKKLLENNVTCGVCPKDYYVKKEESVEGVDANGIS